MIMIDQIYKYSILSIVGGVLYGLIEIIARGYTHWTMIILGAICFVLLGLLNEWLEWDTPLILQMLYGAIIITVLEFTTGCIVNLWLGWNVWDYSDRLFNILGQVCLQNSMYWYFLSAVGIILDDYLRYWLFNEDKPRYKII